MTYPSTFALELAPTRFSSINFYINKPLFHDNKYAVLFFISSILTHAFHFLTVIKDLGRIEQIYRGEECPPQIPIKVQYQPRPQVPFAPAAEVGHQ